MFIETIATKSRVLSIYLILICLKVAQLGINRDAKKNHTEVAVKG